MHQIIPYELALVIFIVLVLSSRWISVQAIKKLPPEKKAELVDKFSSYSFYGIIPIVVLLLVYYCLTHYFPEIDFRKLTMGYTIAVLFVILVLQAISYRKLKSIGVSKDFLKMALISRFLSIAGIAMLLLAIPF